jgi:hypothetical protein
MRIFLIISSEIFASENNPENSHHQKKTAIPLEHSCLTLCATNAGKSRSVIGSEAEFGAANLPPLLPYDGGAVGVWLRRTPLRYVSSLRYQ